MLTESLPSPASIETFSPVLSIVSASPSAFIVTLEPVLIMESARAVPVMSVALVVLLMMRADSSSDSEVPLRALPST